MWLMHRAHRKGQSFDGRKKRAVTVTCRRLPDMHTTLHVEGAVASSRAEEKVKCVL